MVLNSENLYQNHIDWIIELNNEYNILMNEQNMEYSPCTRTRNTKQIWNNEWRKPPRIDRQNGEFKETIITVSI